MAERVGRLEEWAEGHESRCEERLDGIKDSLRNLQRSAWMLIIAICGWALTQIYDTVKNPPPPTQSVVVAPAGPGAALPR